MKSSIILAAGLGKRVREYSLDLRKMTIYKDILIQLVKAKYLMVFRLLEKKHSKT